MSSGLTFRGPFFMEVCLRSEGARLGSLKTNAAVHGSGWWGGDGLAALEKEMNGLGALLKTSF